MTSRTQPQGISASNRRSSDRASPPATTNTTSTNSSNGPRREDWYQVAKVEYARMPIGPSVRAGFLPAARSPRRTTAVPRPQGPRRPQQAVRFVLGEVEVPA